MPVISVHSVTGMSRSGRPGRLGSGFAPGWAEGLAPLPLSLGPPLTHGLPHGHDCLVIFYSTMLFPAVKGGNRRILRGFWTEDGGAREKPAAKRALLPVLGSFGMGLLSPSAPGRRRPCSTPGPSRGRWLPGMPAMPRRGCRGSNGTDGP